MRRSLLNFILASACGASALLAASSPIGVVTSGTSLRINKALAPSNATVFDGSQVSTEAGTAVVRLTSGGRLTVDARSDATLRSDRIVLDRGAVTIAGYAADANQLQIKAVGSSRAHVAVKGPVVEVASLSGSTQVFNAQGLNVANIPEGKAVSLSVPANASNAVTNVTGMVTRRGNSLFLTDDTSQVTMELRGGPLTPGHRFAISGTLAKGGEASTVLDVATASETSGEGSGAAAGGGAGPQAPAGGGAGESHTAAILAGITVAGVLAGIAALASHESEPFISPTR